MKLPVSTFYVILWIGMLSPALSRGQAIRLSMDTVEGCPGDTIEVPIWVYNFNNVGAVTLIIQYNPAELVYDTTLACHPQLPGMLVNKMSGSIDAIGFSWFSFNMNGVHLGDTSIATMRFIKQSDFTQLHFTSQCEIADPVGAPLQVIYQDGAIVANLPDILHQPEDAILKPGNNAQFTLIPAKPGILFKWFGNEGDSIWKELSDSGIYSGTKTSMLSVFSVGWQHNGWKYRCWLTEGTCTGFSETAALWVDTVDAIEEGIGGYLYENSPYPNPFAAYIYIPLPQNALKKCTFALFDLMGRLVKSDYEDNGSQKSQSFYTMWTTGESPGSYILVIQFIDIAGVSKTYRHHLYVK